MEPLAPGQGVAGPSRLRGHLRLAGDPVDPPVGQFGPQDRDPVAIVRLHPVGEVLDLADLDLREGVELAKLLGALGNLDQVLRSLVVAGDVEGQVSIVRIVRVLLQPHQ